MSSRSDEFSDSTAASTAGFTSVRCVPFRMAILIGKCNGLSARSRAPSHMLWGTCSLYDTIYRNNITNGNMSLGENASPKTADRSRISPRFPLRGSIGLSQMSHPISGKPEESITHMSLTRRQIGNAQRLSCRWLLFAARGVLLSPHSRSGVARAPSLFCYGPRST